MNKRSFLVLVGTLMFCVMFFAMFMQSHPDFWAMVSVLAFLVIIALVLYHLISLFFD